MNSNKGKIKMSIGKNIKIELIKQGLNQGDLQRLTDLSQPTITKVLNDGGFKYSTLVKICLALDVKESDLFKE